MEGLFVHQFRLGPWDNFIYFIGDKASRHFFVVDPAWHADTIISEAERLDITLSGILCTHSHFDHVDQVETLLETHDVPVHMLGAEVDFSGFGCENLVRSSSGDTVKLGEHVEITMLHTPGHTPGSTCYRIGDALVTGDTLFVNGCGRCDFVGGDPEVMFSTLKRLTEDLPSHTVIYPGHDYGPTTTATVDAQLAENPYLRHETIAAFVGHRMEGKTAGSALPPKPAWSPG